jgi:hypothetical protein
MGVHGMSFAGPDILPTANPAGTEVWLEESNEPTQTPTNWVSHPTGIGYRRSSPGVTTYTGSGSGASSSTSPPIPGNAPSMDTGLSDGGTTTELYRLTTDFISGGNENPTAMTPGPIPRAKQLALPTSPLNSPGVTNLLLTDPDADLPVSNLLLLLPADGSSVDPGIVAIRSTTPSGSVGPGPGGPQQRSLWDDAAYQLGRLWQGVKTEAGLVGGTLSNLPGALAETFSNGQAFDSFQGFAKHSKLMAILDPASQLLPDDPLFGNREDFDQAANLIAPMADEIAIQVTIGRVLGPLGCVGANASRARQLLALGFKLVRLGYAGKAGLDAVQALKTAVANGDSVGALKAIISLGGALYDALSGGCFAAGTPILTPEGSKPIEDIRPGDWVITAPDDDPDAEPVPRQVEATFENYLPLLDLYVNGRTIRTTAEHPFWVRDRGWVAAHQLEAGDELRAHDGRWLKVDGFEGPKPSAPVYNMCVAEYHTYFIGHQIWGFAIWSHNMGLLCRTRRNSPNRGRPNPITGTPRQAPSFKPDPKNNVTAKPRTVDMFLDDAERFLGKGYYTGEDGALYSADGSRRVRFNPADLGGHNGGPPHGHFEFNGGRNIHIPLTDT